MRAFSIYVPWIGSITAELFLLCAMVHRRLLQRFPWFFICIAYQVVREGLLFGIARTPLPHSTYFYVYLISIPLEYTLTIAVICEVFGHAFQGRLRLFPGAFRLFVALNLLLLAISAALIFRREPPITGFAGSMLVADRSAESVRTGMLLFLCLFAGRLKITWRHHLWGIVFGLGMYSAIGLITATANAATGRMCSNWLTPIPHFAYFFAAIVWAFYFLKPEPEREPLTMERLNFYRGWLDLVRNASLQMRRVLHDDD